MPAYPSLISRLLHPELARPVPHPARVDLRPMLVVGTSAWALALVVFAVLGLASGESFDEQVAVCVAGLALGGAGFVWERGHRSRYPAVGEHSSADRQPPAPEDGRETTTG